MQGNTHTYALATTLTPHHCLNGEVYRGDRHVCEQVGLGTNCSLRHAPERDVLA
jgi:hypothetical protein